MLEWCSISFGVTCARLRCANPLSIIRGNFKKIVDQTAVLLCFRDTVKNGPWRIFLKHLHLAPNQEAWQINQRRLIYLQKLLYLCHTRVEYADCSAQTKLDCRITSTEAIRNQTAKCLNVTSAIEVTCPLLSLSVISEKTIWVSTNTYVLSVKRDFLIEAVCKVT